MAANDINNIIITIYGEYVWIEIKIYYTTARLFIQLEFSELYLISDNCSEIAPLLSAAESNPGGRRVAFWKVNRQIWAAGFSMSFTYRGMPCCWLWFASIPAGPKSGGWRPAVTRRPKRRKADSEKRAPGRLVWHPVISCVQKRPARNAFQLAAHIACIKICVIWATKTLS